MEGLEVITREQLELERIEPGISQKVYCDYQERCSEAGNFIRCYLDTCVFCPRYESYRQQQILRDGDE